MEISNTFDRDPTLDSMKVKTRRPSVLFRSESGISTPIPLPDVYNEPEFKYPGLDMAQSSTGVIWTTERAAEKGFTSDDPTWANLGQGAPEVGDIPGCFKKPNTIDVSVNTREYAPTSGLKELRQAVADLYNAQYRGGKISKYTYVVDEMQLWLYYSNLDMRMFVLSLEVVLVLLE